MENLNAEQVKKALECCLTTSEGDCIACGYRGKKDGLFITCTNCLMADALALINSQEQRINELTEENERLHASCTELTQCCTKLETLYKIESKRVDTVKADTVRKMQHKIWLEFSDCYVEDKITVGSFRASVDQIAKEMLGASSQKQRAEPDECTELRYATMLQEEKDNG